MRFESSFDLIGDLIGVDAVVVGPRGRANVQLLLDTGSVYTTLVPSVTEALGYNSAMSIQRTVTRTAAANESGYLVRLVELSVLGLRVPDVRAHVSDLGYGIDGILGMNFLRRYNIEIRPLDRRILIELAVAP